MTPFKRRVASAVAWSLAGSWSREVINLVTFLLLSRLLGPEAYGIAGMAMVLTAVSYAILVESFTGFIVQRRDLEPEHVDAIFWLSMALGVAMAVLMIAGAPLVSLFFDHADVTGVVRALAVLPILYALSAVPQELLKRNFAFRVLGVRGALASLAGGATGVTLALTGHGVWSLVAMQIVLWTVQVIVLWVMSDWRPSLRFSSTHLKDIRYFAANALATRGLITLDLQVPRVMVGYFFGPVALGYFTMAWRLVEILTVLIIMPFSQVATSTFSHLQDDRPRLGAALTTTMQATTLLAFPSFVGIAVVAPELVTTVFGPKWEGAIPLLQCLPLVGLAWSVNYCLYALLRGTGVMGWRTATAAIELAATAVILPFCVPYGLEMIVVGIVLRSLVTLPVSLYVVRRKLQLAVSPLFRSMIPAVVGTVGMVALIAGWQSLMQTRLTMHLLFGSSVVVGVAAFVAVTCLVAPSMLTTMLRFASQVRSGRA